MSEKHKPPKLCYIRQALVVASPSAVFTRCTLGLRHGCRRCTGCEANVAEQWADSLEKGLEEGKQNPRWRFNEDGSVTELRPATPEEVRALEDLRQIAERAFGIYHEEGDQ
jgi:hypothetical protein